MLICGIDPGLKGALCFLDIEKKLAHIYDMPVQQIKNKRVVDGATIARLTVKHAPTVVYVEDVYTSSQMGVVSAGNFMYGKSSIETALSVTGTRTVWVTPAVWKRSLRLPADKKKTVARASILFPSISHMFAGSRGGLKDGRAEACCIALYGVFNEGKSFSGVEGGQLNENKK